MFSFKKKGGNSMIYKSTKYALLEKHAKANKFTLTKNEVKNLKFGNRIHFLQDTILGSYLYNATVLYTTEVGLVVKPAKWKKQAYLLRFGEVCFFGKGWK